MQRRQFLIRTATAVVAQMLLGNIRGQGETMAGMSDLTYHILGVPLRAGSLLPGNENDAQAYRDVQLLARLKAAGCKAVDDGDVAIPSYLPHPRFLQSGVGLRPVSSGIASAIALFPF